MLLRQCDYTTGIFMNRCYTQLIQRSSFEDRYSYLRLESCVGSETFGADRYLNQKFYKSSEWERIRDYVIVRDNGCDLAIPDRPIFGKIIIHHMNPMKVDDIIAHSEAILDPEYLICVSHATHNAIHYGDSSLLIAEPVIRRPGDTCLWGGNR